MRRIPSRFSGDPALESSAEILDTIPIHLISIGVAVRLKTKRQVSAQSPLREESAGKIPWSFSDLADGKQE
jgi:hypothetical protein